MQRIGAMIGSPGDASEERRAITDAILRWNAVNRDKGIFVEPVKWETHATPGLQGRPQGMINAELIQFVEETPDTVITLTTHEKVLVKESADEVVRKAVEYGRSLRVFPDV